MGSKSERHSETRVSNNTRSAFLPTSTEPVWSPSPNARAPMIVAISRACSAGTNVASLRPSLMPTAMAFMARIVAKCHVDSTLQQRGNLAIAQATALLHRRAGTDHDRRPCARDQLDFEVVDASHVCEQHVRPQNADIVEVLHASESAHWRAAVVVERDASPVLVGEA